MNGYALQLYSVRDSAEQDLRGTLRQVATLGYTGVEFAGFFGHDADVVAAWLAENGLRAVGSHMGLDALAPDTVAQTVAYHKALALTELTVPHFKYRKEHSLCQ